MLIDLRGDVFTEQVVSGIIENGDLTRLIQKSNRLYRGRCHFLADLITSEVGEAIEFTRPSHEEQLEKAVDILKRSINKLI